MIALAPVVAPAAGAQDRSAPPLDVSTLAVSAPTFVCDIDLASLKGELRRLSSSPDAKHLHLQTLEDRTVPHDFIVAIDDRELAVAFVGPEWAAAYRARKSDLAAPGVPALALEVTETNRRTRPAPFSGGFANGCAQTPDVENPVDAYEAEVLRFLGVQIGDWINGAPMTGDTFGWGPTGSGALAFGDRPGRLHLIDRHRRTQTVAGV